MLRNLLIVMSSSFLTTLYAIASIMLPHLPYCPKVLTPAAREAQSRWEAEEAARLDELAEAERRAAEEAQEQGQDPAPAPAATAPSYSTPSSSAPSASAAEYAYGSSGKHQHAIEALMRSPLMLELPDSHPGLDKVASLVRFDWVLTGF